MAITSKYFITNADLDTFIDFGLPYGSLTLDGQEIKVIGSAAEESIFVRPGMTVDFTSSSGGVDKIYLEGNFAEYTISTNAGVATVTGGGATVTFSKGASELGSDRLVFADGTVNSWHIFGGGTITPVPGSETSLLPDPPAAPASAQLADVEAIALDSSGETFALVRPGIDYTVTGSAGVDSVYVSRGATVDARGLRGSRDDIYFTGQWGDYSKTVGNGDLTFTRDVDGHTETVRVSAGTGSNNDRLIFADGAVLSNNAKGALANPIVPITEIPGYSATPLTPLPAAPVIGMVAGDDIITVNEQDSAIIGTSFAHARIALTLGAGNVQTATADAQGHWSYTLRPGDIIAMEEGPETISAVAMDTHGNLSAPATRPITIDGNHAPINSGPVTGSGNENDPSHTLNLLANTTDSDGDPLTVGSLTYTVNGTATGNGGADLPTGVSLSGSTLSIDTNNTGFNSLAAGEQQNITASYTISDGHGGTVNQSATFTVNGVNDAPVINNPTVNSAVNGLFASQSVPGTAIAGPEIELSQAWYEAGEGGWYPYDILAGWNYLPGDPRYDSYWVNNIGDYSTGHSGEPTLTLTGNLCGEQIRTGWRDSIDGGTSQNGGGFAQLGSFDDFSLTGMQTVLTGLVVGQTYVYGMQWQQMREMYIDENGSNYYYAGGQLVMSVDGRSQVYTSSGLNDGWNTALYSFTATSSEATLQVYLNGLTGVTPCPYPVKYGWDGYGGNIAVDSLSAAQTNAANPLTPATGVSTSSLFGTVTDVDHNAAVKGWAITSAAADTSGHHWQYSTDSGTTWINMDNASLSQAVYLAASDMVHWTGLKGTNTELDAKAVDDTGPALHAANAEATLIDVSASGGSTAFSAGTAVLPANAPPLLFDLNHDGRIDYSQITMNVDGHQVDTAWVGAGDGLLVWDKYNDGQVHDSDQYVFGQTSGSDLSGLRLAFDSNNDLVFDARDAQFNQFGIWQDVNQNGAVDTGELQSLSQLDISSLALTSDGVASTPASGVTVQGQTTAILSDGSTMLVADAIFSSQRSATEVVPATGINPTEFNPDGGVQVIHYEQIDQATDSVTAYAVCSQGDYAQMLIDSAITRAGL